MAEPQRPARWRCPACGEPLERSAANGSEGVRLECPGCGGQFRVRRREGRNGEPATAAFSGEVPAGRPAAPGAIGGFGLAWRGLALRGVAAAFPPGNAIGGATCLLLGGFVPVIRGWLRDEIVDWAGVATTLGGVSVDRATASHVDNTGPRITRSDAPDLFAELDDVGRRLRARPPELVRLVYPPCCGVLMAGRSRTLLIGLPLLQALTRAEFRAVLAHELAHLARGDAASADRASRFVLGLGRAIDAAGKPSRSPLRLWARLCRGAAERLHAPIAWGQEARADRAAASVAGGAVAASALVKVAAVQPLFRMAADAFDPRSDARNLYEFFREFLARLPESVWAGLRHDHLRGDGPPGRDASHPPLLDRLAAMQDYADRPAAALDAAPASTLLGDPELFEAMLHDRLFALGRVEPSVFQRLRGRRR